MEFAIDAAHLSLDELAQVLAQDSKLSLSESSREKVRSCRTYLDNKMKEHTSPIYGINTGFGSLCDTKISNEKLEQLQDNLVMSHACGMGDEVPSEVVRIMLLLKVKGLSLGYSAAQVETLDRLMYLYNEGLFPVVYQQGSLGASGDLAPLAHMSLPLIGEGQLRNQQGELVQTEDLYKEKGMQPIRLKSKEGLALLNGTQFMSSYGSFLVLQSQRLMQWADLIASLSLEAFDGRIEPFQDNVHLVRPHQGQLETARAIRKYTTGSEMIAGEKIYVQDPYSFRCVPQVHGATKDALRYIAGVMETEINSVTDNPTVFEHEDDIVSAGNFHGQPLALVLDHLSLAMSELGSISERRVYKLISGTRGLPAFLVANPGLNSGFMIPQYTAASIVSQNKHYCMPASADTIDSSNGQEDHVSMGANAATKAYKVVQNVEQLLAVELFAASQALEFRRPKKTSPVLEQLVSDFRKQVQFVEEDKVMYKELHKAVEFVKNYNLQGLIN